MAKTIDRRISDKAPETKPLGKLLSGDKKTGLEPATRFYEQEYGDKTEEGEESEILINHDKSLTASKQNLVKKNFHYIDTFDHVGLTLVIAMNDLTIIVFDNLKITSTIYVYQRIAYT